jgi:hypothetical protein
MQINVNLRAKAARTLLDAVSVMDLDDHGTEDADARVLLALEQLGLQPLERDPTAAATVAAAMDLLWFTTLTLSQWRGETREATISTLRQDVLPRVYPDASA